MMRAEVLDFVLRFQWIHAYNRGCINCTAKCSNGSVLPDRSVYPSVFNIEKHRILQS